MAEQVTVVGSVNLVSDRPGVQRVLRGALGNKDFYIYIPCVDLPLVISWPSPPDDAIELEPSHNLANLLTFTEEMTT